MFEPFGTLDNAGLQSPRDLPSPKPVSTTQYSTPSLGYYARESILIMDGLKSLKEGQKQIQAQNSTTISAIV